MGTVTLERTGAVATLTLNRPEVLNALNRAMAIDLGAAIEELTEDDAVRCVVMRGAGRGFMAGGDIAAMQANLATIEDFVNELIGLFHKSVLGLAAMPKPVIGSLHGPIAGAGVSLAVNNDYAIAADNAVFNLAYINLATIPDGGSTYLLPRLVGRRRAMELALLSAPLDAAGALEMGLINRVVAAAALEAETMALAEKFARGPTRAYAATRRLINRSFEADSMAAHLADEQQAFLGCAVTQDFAEATTAFVEKRKPAFRGR
jgi:2-(1,2-epoxy-1,2-dihydrophenyl)acetyl-CoA isomerase